MIERFHLKIWVKVVSGSDKEKRFVSQFSSLFEQKDHINMFDRSVTSISFSQQIIVANGMIIMHYGIKCKLISSCTLWRSFWFSNRNKTI